MFFDERGNGGKLRLFVEHGKGAHAFGGKGLANELFGGVEPFGEALCVLVQRTFQLSGHRDAALRRDETEQARRRIGVEPRPPREEDPRNALCGIERRLDALLPLTGEGGKGEEDDVCLAKARGGESLGQQGEIAALVDEPARTEKLFVSRKQQREIFEFCGKRAFRFLRPAQEQLFIDAGRHELGERFIDGLRGAAAEDVQLAFFCGKDGGDRHHRPLFGKKARARLRPRKKAGEGGDLGEHGAPHRFEHGAFREQSHLVFAEDERPFPPSLVFRDGGRKGGERIVERGRPDDVGHSPLLRAGTKGASRPTCFHYSTFAARFS